ncbi:hypothetical protein HY218_01415 [Candidatus Saccharibacteria bacterium]|nr:hypothetical protein [Candidatus Saccharibacteria bacterium]
MIQFNLLPEVKLAYLKTQRTKHLVFVVATLVSASALAVLILLFLGVSIFQKQHLNDLNKDIKSDISKLQQVPDLNKILTVQNQLDSLDALHNKKPVSSRFFAFANKFTPSSVTISSANLDFTNNTISLGGNAPDLNVVNTFVDTLKFTNYKLADSSQVTKAFSNVVLSSFSLVNTKSGSDPNKKASYQIALKFDPLIFDITKAVTLDVPRQITTRSETEKPVFQSSPTNDNQSN